MRTMPSSADQATMMLQLMIQYGFTTGAASQVSTQFENSAVEFEQQAIRLVGPDAVTGMKDFPDDLTDMDEFVWIMEGPLIC